MLQKFVCNSLHGRWGQGNDAESVITDSDEYKVNSDDPYFNDIREQRDKSATWYLSRFDLILNTQR